MRSLVTSLSKLLFTPIGSQVQASSTSKLNPQLVSNMMQKSVPLEKYVRLAVNAPLSFCYVVDIVCVSLLATIMQCVTKEPQLWWFSLLFAASIQLIIAGWGWYLALGKIADNIDKNSRVSERYKTTGLKIFTLRKSLLDIVVMAIRFPSYLVSKEAISYANKAPGLLLVSQDSDLCYIAGGQPFKASVLRTEVIRHNFDKHKRDISAAFTPQFKAHSSELRDAMRGDAVLDSLEAAMAYEEAAAAALPSTSENLSERQTEIDVIEAELVDSSSTRSLPKRPVEIVDAVILK